MRLSGGVQEESGMGSWFPISAPHHSRRLKIASKSRHLRHRALCGQSTSAQMFEVTGKALIIHSSFRQLETYEHIFPDDCHLLWIFTDPKESCKRQVGQHLLGPWHWGWRVQALETWAQIWTFQLAVLLAGQLDSCWGPSPDQDPTRKFFSDLIHVADNEIDAETGAALALLSSQRMEKQEP